MRQQEANQFDKGMSLDTNAIAMDNHTLSGALNATMITMNGNELVLQNDMGNAKVESAYLPSGFVPVGMQEFGGIVYVASYNPFTKESQIGSFPSPERNVSGEENGQDYLTLNNVNSGENGVVSTLSSRIRLIKGPIRAGDKFRITSNSNNGSLAQAIEDDLVTFKVLVLDEDGSGIDITKDMHGYSAGSPLGFVNNGTFTTYKSKIAGAVWLQESLVVPAYISVSITSTANARQNENDPQTTNLKFTAHAYDSEGNPWETSHPKNAQVMQGFEYKVDGNVINDGELNNVELGRSTILKYEVTPKYAFGKIIALTQTGSVAVDLLGSGNIEIPELRYYNDVVNDQFILDYVINAYVESSEHSVSSVCLEAYDYKDCTINGNSISLGTPNEIYLSSANTFGSYTAIIPYAQSSEEGGKLLKGHMYIARMVANRSTPVENSDPIVVPYTSKWFVIITSAITNDTYMSASSGSMFSCDEEHIIDVDWDIEWTEKELGHAYQDECLPETNTGTSIPTELAEGELITLQTTRTGDIILEYKAKVVVDTIDTNFPFDIETASEISIPEDVPATQDEEAISNSVYSTIIDYTGGKSRDGLLASEENIPINMMDDASIAGNQVWSNINLAASDGVDFSKNVEDSSVQRTLHYRIHSQFVAEPTELQHFVGNDMPALVQYQTNLLADEDTIRDMLGADVYDATAGVAGVYSHLTPQTWWSWGTRKGRKKNTRERLMGLMQANQDYTLCSQAVEEIPEPESMTDTGYGIFNTSTTNASWRYYSTVTMDYIHNSLKLYPYLFFWQGANDDSTTFWRGDFNTKDYTIPIMLDATGEMYLIGQYKTGYGHGEMLLDIIKCFNNIYVYQQSQTVEYDYYKASNELLKYVYTNPYQMKIDCTYEATPTITFKCGEEEYQGGAFTLGNTIIHLPEFRQAEFSKRDTEKKTFTKYVYSPDQIAKNLEYLDAEPTLGNVAIIKNSNGTTSIVATGRKVENGVDVGTEPLDVSHVYFGIANGKNTELYDCTKQLPSVTPSGTYLTNSTEGKLIADAIRNRYLRVIYSSENDRNILIINKSAVTNKAARTCNIEIGEQKMRTSLSGIASKHLLNVPLFTGSGITDMQITS